MELVLPRILVFGYKAVLNRGFGHAGTKKDPMTNHKVYRIKLTAEERDTFAQVAKGKRGKLKIAAWQADRNERQTGIDWQFSTSNARIKLKRLYPKVELR